MECLGSLSLEKGRGLGFSAINHSTWPYGIIVSRALAENPTTLGQFLGKFLPSWITYQEWFREQSVGSFLGLSQASRLSRIPAWAHVLPWGEKSPGEMMKWLPPRIRRNRRANGNRIGRLNTYRGIMLQDSLSSGPSHGKQFFDLSQSIKNEGLWSSCNPHDPYKVWLLEEGADSRWMAYSGNHRTGAIAALGVTEVHAELRGSVSKSNLKHWPNVANGWFTHEEAETIFDRLFGGFTVPATVDLLARLGGCEDYESR